MTEYKDSPQNLSQPTLPQPTLPQVPSIGPTPVPWQVWVVVTVITAALPFVAPILSTVLERDIGSSSLVDVPKETPSITPSVQASTPPAVVSTSQFVVIAAESQYFENLKNEPVRAVGHDFRQTFSSIKVCPAIAKANTFYLVIGTGLTEAEAETLKTQAISNNFSPETYILQENLVPFSLVNCSPI